MLDYKESALWYVADKVEIIDSRLWNKRSQKFIYTEGEIDLNTQEILEFYVDPQTNKLVHNPYKSFKKIVKADRNEI